MMLSENFRIWISKNIAPVIFLAAYFVTVCLGNILYFTAYGSEQLKKYRYTAEVLQFETLFTSGYWLLLFIPFIMTPLIIVVVRKALSNYFLTHKDTFPEFSKREYTLVLIVSYAYVIYAMFNADAFFLFLTGTDPVSSVEARFQIRNQLGFAPLVVLMSVLHFLSIYALVKWIMSGGRFWLASTVANTVLMSVSLVLLNMKWPILIFYAGLVLAVFMYTKRYAYFKAIVGGALLIAMYFMISAFVFRLMPTAQVPQQPSAQQQSSTQAQQEEKNGQTKLYVEEQTGKILMVGEAAAEHAPMLLFNVINRMAIIYPYYYQVFTKEGQVCGGIIAQARIGPACRPSTFIYTRIFNDSFNGRGTAPAAVHISGYALGGWPIALFALLCASVVLGVFASLPLYSGAMMGSLAVTGAIVGYHFSQVPGEGPIFYDHGVFWVVLSLCLFKLWRLMMMRFSSNKKALKI